MTTSQTRRGRGRPCGSKNAHATRAAGKMVTLPAAAWERLEALGKPTRRSPQKIAAGIILDWLEAQDHEGNTP